MMMGVVYPVRFEGQVVPSRIEIAFRGETQLLPGGSIGFLTEAELDEAIDTVAESLGWQLPPELPIHAIWRDVESGIGWEFHPSKNHEKIPVGDGKTVVVYRQEINSCLP